VVESRRHVQSPRLEPAKIGLSNHPAPWRRSGCWVAINRTPANVSDVSKDERWLHIPGVDDGVRSAICAPIIAGDTLLGVLTVMRVRAGAFTSNHLTLLQAICQEVGLALSNATRYQQAQRQLAEITLIHNLAQTFNRRLGLQDLLNEVCVQLAERLDYPLVEICLIQDDALLQRASYGAPQSNDLIPLGQGIIGKVARTGQVILTPDIRDDPDYIPSFLNTVSELAVPIFHGTVVVGVINIETSIPGRLTAQDRDLLEVLAGQISIALENAVLYERLRQHAKDLEHNVVERNTELTELYELSQEIGLALSNLDLLQMLVSHLRNALSSDLTVGGLFMNGKPLLIIETTRPLKAACMNALRSYWLEKLNTYGLDLSASESIPIEVVSAETFNSSIAPLEQIDSLISSPIQIANSVVGILIAEPGRTPGEAQARSRTPHCQPGCRLSRDWLSYWLLSRSASSVGRTPSYGVFCCSMRISLLVTN
jgi:GAF domain-containing protein